jgi:hypothetical protein
MPDVPAPFDFLKPAAYCRSAKRAFHRAARRQLVCLADALDLPPGAYAILRHRGRMGRSGRIVLHAGLIYVEVSQPNSGPDSGVMFRSCQGRTGFDRSAKHFAPLELLNRPEELARRIRERCRV